MAITGTKYIYSNSVSGITLRWTLTYTITTTAITYSFTIAKTGGSSDANQNKDITYTFYLSGNKIGSGSTTITCPKCSSSSAYGSESSAISVTYKFADLTTILVDDLLNQSYTIGFTSTFKSWYPSSGSGGTVSSKVYTSSTINLATDTITISAQTQSAVKTYPDTTGTFSIKTTSGKAVTFTSDKTATAASPSSISTSSASTTITVTFKIPGTVTITCETAAGYGYAAASTETTVTLNKGTPSCTITYNSSGLTYNAGSAIPIITKCTISATKNIPTYYYTVATSKPSSITANTTSVTNAGSYYIYYYIKSNSYWNEVAVTLCNSTAVVVSKANNTLTASGVTTTYNSLANLCSVSTNKSGGTLSYKINNITTTTIPKADSSLSANSYTLSITSAATTNYNSATTNVNVVINKATPVITVVKTDTTYDGSVQELFTISYDSSYTGTVTTYCDTSSIPTTVGNTGIDAGTYYFAYEATSTSNYNGLSKTVAELIAIINKADNTLTISYEPVSESITVLPGKPQTLTVTATHLDTISTIPEIPEYIKCVQDLPNNQLLISSRATGTETVIFYIDESDNYKKSNEVPITFNAIYAGISYCVHSGTQVSYSSVATPYIYTNGAWKSVIPYVWTDGKWKMVHP